jgi:hypothetical protein
MFWMTLTFIIFGGVYLVLFFINLFLGAMTEELEKETKSITNQRQNYDQ